jgi:hypothetical protein
MNQFSSLDSMLPSGTIVGLELRVLVVVDSAPNGELDFDLNWKQKTSKKSSTNAFNMHRGLCREIRRNPMIQTLVPMSTQSFITKELGLLIGRVYRLRGVPPYSQWFKCSLVVLQRLDGTFLVESEDPVRAI